MSAVHIKRRTGNPRIPRTRAVHVTYCPICAAPAHACAVDHTEWTDADICNAIGVAALTFISAVAAIAAAL